MAQTTNLGPIPLRAYVAWTLACGVVGVGVLWGVLAMSGADARTTAVVLACVGALALLGLVPAACAKLVAPAHWGLLVLGASGARTILAIGVLLGLVEVLKLPRRPVALGVLTGAVVLMVCEATIACVLLARRDRAAKSGAEVGDRSVVS